MTTSDPSARDELVAAYLDGEATQAERARVEADPELMVRVEIMSQVAELVAEPVVPPPAEVRHQHIAEALAVSATAPNVTSIAPRRRWSPDYTRVLGAAAAILVVLFAGSLLLLNSDRGGDDSATSAESPPIAVFDGAAEVANTEEDLGDSDDTAAADADTEGADEADAADSTLVEDPEAEAEEDPPAEEASADNGGGVAEPAPTAAARFESAPQLAAGEFDDTGQLALTLSQALQSEAELFSQDGELASLQCTDMLSQLLGDQEPLLVGNASVAGEVVEYVVVDGPEGMRVTIVDAATCGIFDDLPVA